MSSATAPSFFKVFLLERSGHRMKVPSAFRGHMKGKKSGVVYLRGPNGNRWSVELVEQSGKLYFAQGWRKFVRDHSIREPYFLVFEFDGNDTFKVEFYRPNGCKVEAALGAGPSRVGNGSRHGHVEDREDDDAENGAGRDLPPAPSAVVYPCFVLQLNPHNVHGRCRGIRVEIPRPFSRLHMSHIVDESTPIRLQWENKEWPARLSRCGNRSYIYQGWREFVSESKVQEGDSCLFELLGRHLFRLRVVYCVHEEQTSPMARVSGIKFSNFWLE